MKRSSLAHGVLLRVQLEVQFERCGDVLRSPIALFPLDRTLRASLVLGESLSPRVAVQFQPPTVYCVLQAQLALSYSVPHNQLILAAPSIVERWMRFPK